MKLHGSTDSPDDVILTRSDYAKVARVGGDAFAALSALSLTSTILFVGYSLDDPDIQLVLQAVGRSGLSPEAHFMLSPEPASPARLPVFKEAFGVSVVSYPAGDYGAVESALSDLADLVLAARGAMAGSPP